MLGHRVRFNNQLNWAFRMAAPPPPPAGAGTGAGGGGLGAPPPPLGGGPGAPPPPLPGGGLALLAQLVQAMQAAAAALPPPGLGAPPPPPRVKIPLKHYVNTKPRLRCLWIYSQLYSFCMKLSCQYSYNYIQ